MSESFLDGRVILYPGDCLDVLMALPDDYVDSVVTDPPYHLTSIVRRFGGENAAPAQFGTDGRYARASAGFMGKIWDGGDIAFRSETWAAVLRVLKPGGHLLAFGGTRTSHRVACAIEDAGFEIRDTIMWLYGSGFPKSHDVSKGIDRAAGAERGEERPHPTNQCRGGQWCHCFEGEPTGRFSPTKHPAATDAATSEAVQWAGWGTALKPAVEPIVMARKPLSEGTVAANVLRWGTGAINVGGCRVEHDEECRPMQPQKWEGREDRIIRQAIRNNPTTELKANGRWPANVIHDSSEEVVGAFPETASGDPGNSIRNSKAYSGIGGSGLDKPIPLTGFGDSGSAARFFYTAKADADDRLGSKHPTVKPVDLMQYLVRLVTPKGGVVLDPFAGTGTTAEAAFYEGMRAILIERETEYQADIRRRMALVMAGPVEKQHAIVKAKGLTESAGPLFDALRDEPESPAERL